MNDSYLDPPEDDEFDGEEIEPDYEAMLDDDAPFEDRDCDYWNGVT
jgi:hypothetical protein